MVKFYDRQKIKLRSWLSHHPKIYALVAGAGVIIFWRGIWLSMDYLMSLFKGAHGSASIDFSQGLWWDGPLSVIIGAFILLFVGAFVSSLIGNEIIINGLRGEKRVEAQTEKEVKTEAVEIDDIRQGLVKLTTELAALEEEAVNHTVKK